MRSFTKAVTFFLIALAGLFYESATAQSIIDPSDPVVTYNSAAPPAQPAWGTIGKWVRTKRVSWNSDDFKAYIYKGVQFRLKFPKSYNPTANDGKRYPMISFFHGLGETGGVYDNEYSLVLGGTVFQSAVNNDKFDGYVMVMQSTTGWGGTQFSALTEIIDYMTVNNKLSPFAISANGLSAGGYGTWDMMIDYMPYIASALPMSGVSINHKDAAKIEKYKFTPIWLFQGGLDGSPAPYTAQQVKAAIEAAGGNFRYKEYPNLGHGTWNTVWAEPDFFPTLNRAYSSNPYTLFGRTEFCVGDVINLTVGVAPGFAQYEWRKDGVLIPGATSNSIKVTQIGVYDARVRKGTLWSEWSRIPAVIKIKAPTVTPPIAVSGLMSKVLPALDTDKVTLKVPAGYSSYLWQKSGSTTTLSTDSTLVVSTTGDYKVKVTEFYGCSSDFSPLFTVINANGPNRPDAAINLTATTLSKTSLQLNWSDNPAPSHNETNFEVYQSTTPGGPYKLAGITGQDVVTFTVNGLNSGSNYYYKIRAVNNTAASATNSNEAAGKTASDVQNPAAPANLRVVTTTRTSVSLAWDDATDDVGVVKYEVYINGQKGYTTSSTAFTVNALDTGKNYNFTVLAKDFAGNASPFSNQVTAQAVFKGMTYKYYEGTWSVLPNFNTLTPVKTGSVANVTLEPRVRNDNMGFLFEGYITIPTTGSYTFRTNSDDGSRLYLGTLNSSTPAYSFSATPLVDNDGLHGAQNKDAVKVLTAGTYPIAVTFFNQGGGYSVNVYWALPSAPTTFVAIPDNAFADAVALPGTAPAMPTALKATAASYKAINLQWTDNSNNESGFEIYRSSSLDGTYSIVGVAGANAVSYTDTTLAPVTTYFYKIRAIGNYGESALYSQRVEARWSLDNNYDDATSFARTLVPTGGITFDNVNKKEGTHSVKLNGTTQSLLINTDDNYLKTAYSEKTVAFWMKPTLSNGNKMVFDLGGNDDGIAMSLNTSTVLLWTTTTINIGVASNNVRRSFTYTFSSTDWTHVAVVYNKSAIRLYLNGVEVGNLTDLAFTSIGVTTNGSRIGFHEGNNAFNVTPVRYSGLLDNFTIYGTALPADAIAAHMNNVVVESNAKTLALPVAPNTPTGLVASATGTSAVKVKWSYKGTTQSTTTIPAGTVRTEAEAYSAMTGIATETCSEGGLNVKSIDANDWMDYNVNVPVAGTVTVNFRVATAATATGQFQLRTSDEQILATLNIPKTATTQVFSTVSTTVTLPAGPQTLRIFALKNGWTINWFEITSGSSTTTNTTTATPSSFDVYRSANVNSNYVLLKTVPATDTSFTDAGLFANSVFYYKVKAVSIGGTSADSNEDSAKTLNNAPVIDSIANKVVRYATTVSIPVTASDVDGGTLAYTVVNKPSFATLVASGENQATLNVTPVAANVGTYNDIKVIVNDANGGADTATFSITVNDNYSPVVDTIVNYTLSENDSLNIALSASDLNVADSLTWSVTNLPNAYTLTPGANGTAILKVKPDFAGSGVYAVQVNVNDGAGGTATRSFSLTVNDKNPNTRIYARVKYANNIGAPWNNMEGVNTSNLKDEFDNTTPVGISFSPNWWLPYNAGPSTGNNSGVYPDAVLNDFWYFGYYGGPETANVSVTGLNPAGKYNLTFYAGSVFGGLDNGTTNYAVGAKSVSLNVQNNTTNTVSINDLTPDASGNITVNMSKGLNTPIGYLNALVITSLYDDGTAPAAPKTLAAQNVVGEGVKLTWADAAYNEGGYEVYRSTSLPGAFSLINTTSSGAVTYTDATVSGATQYYYKVRAINTQGASSYTDTVSITTINRIPQLSPIGDLQVKNNQTLNINVTAVDDATDHVTLTASGLPSFVTFTDNGNGTGVLNVTPSANLLGTFSGIKITATDNSDSSRSVVFSIFVVDANLSSTYVNFTSASAVSPQPWNSMAIGYLPFAGTAVGNLKDDSNVSTGVTVTLTDAWQAVSATGQRLRNGTELYPESVLRNGIYFTDANTHRITVSGLTPAKRYNFQFMNSHGTSESTLTEFTVNGQTVSINGSYNSNKTTQINGIVPGANGEVVINVKKSASAVYGMLSSLVIQAYTPGAVATFSPADLRVTDLKTTSVSLQWQDRADNESGYEVWRSVANAGSYSLIATLAANTTSYVNTGLNKNTNYFYVVRAKNGASYSAYSNTVKGYTYSSSVSINFSTSANSAGAPWNDLNWQLGVGSVWNNFIDDRLVPTNVGMVQTDAFEGLYNGGFVTGNNSGIYPDKVIAENFGLFPGGSARIKITGLNYSKTYDFNIFASAQETYGDATAAYTINGKTCLLNANRNRSGILVMSGITPDENGDVEIRVTTFTGSSFGLLGALVINGYDATSTTPPAAPNSVGARVATAEAAAAEVVVLRNDAVKVDGVLSAYPIPFDNNLTVTVPALNHDNVQLSMIDISGREVYSKRYDNLYEGNNIIRLQNDKNKFAPGMYILKVVYINRTEQKVIKVVKR